MKECGYEQLFTHSGNRWLGSIGKQRDTLVEGDWWWAPVGCMGWSGALGSVYRVSINTPVCNRAESFWALLVPGWWDHLAQTMCMRKWSWRMFYSSSQQLIECDMLLIIMIFGAICTIFWKVAHLPKNNAPVDDRALRGSPTILKFSGTLIKWGTGKDSHPKEPMEVRNLI